MKFTIVRHGETLANQKMLLSGQHETPLSENGIKQAKAVAERLKHEKFNAAYSSDLSRAVNTKNAILEFHPETPRQQHAKLRERSFGLYEGKEVALHFAKLKESGELLWEFTPPEGENLINVQGRAAHFLESIQHHSDDAHILIVGHFSINKALLQLILGWPWERWEGLVQGNTCVNVVEIKNGEAIAHLLNCTKHLT
jgi:broad specificity phosphatase PhoE